jgi:nucleotide-binding universal stress UspA family protein
MNKILLPTDFSHYSRIAIEHALQLFQYEEAEFILLHAYSLPSAGAGTMISLDDIIRQEAEKSMKEFLGEVCANVFCSVMNISTKCVLGHARQVIPSSAEALEIDCVAMGTKGAGGLKEVLLGSTAASIVENLNCPLVIIPSESVFRRPRIFALATDSKPLEDSHALDPLVKMAKQHQAKLLQFSVTTETNAEDDSNEGSQQATATLNEPASTKTQFSQADDYLVVQDTNVEHGILEFCENQKVDVLAVVHHEHDFIDRLIHRSMAKKLAMHSGIPLVVLQG